ncbi:MAG: PHP domain-containing protein [Christensenellaceae bacterium]
MAAYVKMSRFLFLHTGYYHLAISEKTKWLPTNSKRSIMIDLHMHSTASDGTDTPQEIITKCHKLGLQLSAITDHDTIDSQAEAIDTAKRLGVAYITGTEFSAIYSGELHILAYGIDLKNQALVTMFEELRESRVQRVHAILERLQKRNMNISFEDVERFSSGNTLGRPHVALALIDKGYASDLQDAFNQYLNENGLCYVQRRKLTPKQTIDLILNAGGVPVLAHPKFIRTDSLFNTVKEMKDMGIMGIEAYYPAHTDTDISKYLNIAKELDLLVTAGSDYHGKMRKYTAIACEKRGGELLKNAIEVLQKYAVK